MLSNRVTDRLFQEVFPVWRVSCSVFCRQIPHICILGFRGTCKRCSEAWYAFKILSVWTEKAGQSQKTRGFTPLDMFWNFFTEFSIVHDEYSTVTLIQSYPLLVKINLDKCPLNPYNPMMCGAVLFIWHLLTFCLWLSVLFVFIFSLLRLLLFSNCMVIYSICVIFFHRPTW